MPNDTNYWSYLDGKMVDVPPIADLCASLYKKFNDINHENKRLRNENKMHRENTWKDEEIRHLKEENERLTKEMTRSFDISEIEQNKIDELKKENNIIDYYFEFHPFAIGIAGYIVDSNSKKKFQFRYE